MLRTRVCDLLGIRYPILQGGMGWVSTAELVAAVSNAGALGTLSPVIFEPDQSQWPGYLRKEIRKTRELTRNPFAVNVGLEIQLHKECIDVALEEKVPILITTAGSPRRYTPYIKQAGARVLHLVFSARQARIAEEVGVDAVIASGVDGGGLLSLDEVPTFSLVPGVVEVVKVPVVACGGIMDARGLVAALALGAEGVQMGSRFLATRECPVHPNYKEALLKAIDTDTIVTGRKCQVAVRALKNPFTQGVWEKETTGLSATQLVEYIGAGRFRRAAVEGDVKDGSIMCGSGVGLVKEILGAGEVVEGIVREAQSILQRLTKVIAG